MKRFIGLFLLCAFAAFGQGQNFPGGSGSGLTPAYIGVPNLPSTGLIVLNQFLDGSGTVASDSSGNSNTCTFAGGGNAPTWNTAANGGGINFVSTSNQFCSYPAAANAVKTWVVGMQFVPAPSSTPLGATVNNSGINVISGSASTGTHIQFDYNPSGAAGQTSQGAYRPWTINNNTVLTASACEANGTFVFGISITGTDAIYLNGQACQLFNSSTTPVQPSGNWELGSSGLSTSTYPGFSGTIYLVAGWNVVLTPAQMAQATQAVQAALTQRGIQQALQGVPATTGANGDTNDSIVIDGDSLTSGTNWPVQGISAGSGAPYLANVGISGTSLPQMVARAKISVDPLFRPAANRNVVHLWGGTNIQGTYQQALDSMSSYCNSRHQLGWKCIVTTIISRTGEESYKDSLNTLIRQYWPQFADGLNDIAANVHYGADGACSNTTYYNADCIHLTAFSDTNIVGPYFVHSFNRTYGNLNQSSSFNTYSGTTFSNPRVLQFVDCPTASGASVNCTLPFNTTAGSLIFVETFCFNCSGVTISTPTDSQSSTYAAVAAQATFNTVSQLRAFAAPNTTGGAALTVTQGFTGGTNSQSFMAIMEVAGAATASPVDIASTIATGSSTTPTATNVTTTLTGDLLIGYGAFGGGSGTGAAIGYQWTPNTAGFTTQNNQLQLGMETFVAGAAGSYGAAFTNAGSNPWGMGLAAIKAVGSSTSTYLLQDVDVYSECNTVNGSVNLVLPDGAWMSGGTITIYNNTQSGVNTCTISGQTPYATGVAQNIITTGGSVGSFTIANGVTAVLKSRYSFTGTAGTNLSPVINWERIQ